MSYLNKTELCFCNLLGDFCFKFYILPAFLCYLYEKEQGTCHSENEVHYSFDPTLQFTFSNFGVFLNTNYLLYFIENWYLF